MELPVHGAHAATVHQRAAVEHAAVGPALAEPADDHRVSARRYLRPAREQLAVGGGRRRLRLLARGEYVAARDELGKDHDLSAAGDGVAEGLERELRAARRSLHIRCDLATRHPHAGRHHAPRDNPILNAARYDSPGATTVRPVPPFSAFVGAVIGSKQMNSCPGGANACAYE